MLRLISTSRDGQSLEYWNNFSYVTENPVDQPEPTCVEGETRQADDGCNDCVCVIGPQRTSMGLHREELFSKCGCFRTKAFPWLLGLGLSSVCWQS